MSLLALRTNSKNLSWKVLLLALGAAPFSIAASGCSDSEDPVKDGGGEAGTPNGEGGQPDGVAGTKAVGGTDAVGGGGAAGAGGSDEPGAIYGIGTLVTADMVSTDYLLLSDKLDFGGEQLSLEQAREFSGQSDLAAHEGSVLVSSGDEPAVTKYALDATGKKLTEVAKVNFTNYGIASAAFWNNQFVSKTKAYMVNGSVELISWDPDAMEINGAFDLPQLEKREGFQVVPGLADRSSVVYDGKYYLPVYWTDENYADRSDDSAIIVVDVATDEIVTTISAPCPGLDYVTVDDDGLIHFSNWTGGPATYYLLDTAPTCIATLDPKTEEVTTKTFASITDGHEGAAFKYAGNGKFVMSVFDEVRADIANAEDPASAVAGLNWQLWSYDPASGDAAPITDVDWNSGAIIHNRVDDKLFSMVPGENYATTTVYDVEDLSAKAVFGITGWSFRLFKLR
jgi:hypothetical protein